MSSAKECKELLTYIKGEIKRANKRYNAKNHYIFAIAKHDYSTWHIHLVTTCNIELPIICHTKPVESLKASCIYLTNNLEWSRFEDYGKQRRYGGSSLLYTQNKKQAYINRLRLWRIRTRQVIAALIMNAIRLMSGCRIKWCQSAVNRCDKTLCKPSIREYRLPVERPPPKNCLRFSITFVSEGGY